MRHLSIMLCVACVAHGGYADDSTSKADAIPKKDEVAPAFQFDGVWKPKAAVLSGALLPPPAVKGITLKIEKDQYEVTVEGEDHSDRGTFTLDTTANPKRMTINSTLGPNKGKTFLAIYEIKNANAMRVCYDLSGKEFPTDFKAPKGTQRYLVGYRRQPSDETKAIESREPQDSE